MSDWLNYHHLLYFWTVAKEGGMTRAAEQLHLAQPTLSSQVKKLEKSLGVKLFHRVGRTLVLTESGQTVFRYADEIFSLGREMSDVLRGQPSNDSIRLLVGVPDALPKLIIYRLLRPALEMEEQVKLVVYEDKLPGLLSELAVHRLDIVLASTPLTPDLHVRAFNHPLGESSTTVLGRPELAAAYRENFPQSLHQAPMILPTQNTTLRRALEQWFDDNDIQPRRLHEFEDSALIKVFAQAGEGLIAAPTAIESFICDQYNLAIVGRLDAIREQFYAITVERRLKHPAIVAITESARANLFDSQCVADDPANAADESQH